MNARLQTVLSHAGVASRRHAVELIEAGRVKVDGVVVTEKGARVDPDVQKILVDGRGLPKGIGKLYFLFNKPKGVITTASDTHDRRKIVDYFRKVGARLFPIGRLDKDTTGLIILTNDGDLAHKLAHPSFEVEKEYEALVGGWVKEGNISRLERGVMLEEGLTAPCRIKILGRNERGVRVSVRIHEGKKRQVRRMFEQTGARVLELKRVRYAGLRIGDLKEGDFRRLSAREVADLKGGKR